MTKKGYEIDAWVQSVQFLNKSTAVLTLMAPAIAEHALPGQFVNLTCNQFLRRPIGIMSVDRKAGSFQLGIQIKGEGTRWIASQKPGTTLSLLGPLGNGFDLSAASRVITVGGGTGVFPLFFVQQVCRERDIEAIAVCGFQSKSNSILENEYNQLGCRTLFASEAGDLSITGHAADALNNLLESLEPVPETVIMTCGPRLMMQSVAAIANANHLSCQVSLEERMACGIGVCLVCACAVKSETGNASDQYKRCCVDGPVFDAEVIQW